MFGDYGVLSRFGAERKAVRVLKEAKKDSVDSASRGWRPGGRSPPSGCFIIDYSGESRIN